MPLTRVRRRATTTLAGVVALVTLLTACAAPGALPEVDGAPPRSGTSPSSHEGIDVWRLHELVGTGQPRVLLRGPQGAYGVIDTELLTRILNIGEKMLQVADKGPEPEWLVLASGSVNAFAVFDGSRPMIAISLGMIRLLGHDDDAWAALLGHELAHVRLGHHRALRERRKTEEITSSVAGVIATVIGLPFASLVTDATVELADRAYSRDDEREADRVGLHYMRQAGFAAQGAISLQQLLLSTRGNSAMPFLSTHPSGEQRIEALRELMRKE